MLILNQITKQQTLMEPSSLFVYGKIAQKVNNKSLLFNTPHNEKSVYVTLLASKVNKVYREYGFSLFAVLTSMAMGHHPLYI